MAVETKVAAVSKKVSKSVGRKDRAKLGTTAYYSLINNVGHSFSEPLKLSLLSYVWQILCCHLCLFVQQTCFTSNFFKMSISRHKH